MQFNVFSNLSNNSMFVGIVIIIFCLQLLLLTFAGTAFGVYPYFGLHPLHWAISVMHILYLDWPWLYFSTQQCAFKMPTIKVVPIKRQCRRRPSSTIIQSYFNQTAFKQNNQGDRSQQIMIISQLFYSIMDYFIIFYFLS